MLAIVNELGETFQACLFLPGADHPPTRGSPVPRRVRLEETPGLLVGAKSLFVRATEPGAFSLLVSVDFRALSGASLEGFGAFGSHQAERTEFGHSLNVYRAPDALRPPRRESYDVAGLSEALAHAVNPAETERAIHGFTPGDAGLSGADFMEADPQLLMLLVMLFQPGVPVGRRWKKLG